MRKNHPRRRDGKPNLMLFDVEYIDLPVTNVCRIYVIPMKTVYVNSNAPEGCNVDRVFHDINRFADFLESCGVTIG